MRRFYIEGVIARSISITSKYPSLYEYLIFYVSPDRLA